MSEMKRSPSRSSSSKKRPPKHRKLESGSSLNEVQVQDQESGDSVPVMKIFPRYMAELPPPDTNTNYGRMATTVFEHKGIWSVVRWIADQEDLACFISMKSTNILSPLRILRNGSEKCALQFVAFEMTIGWYIKKEQVLEVEFEEVSKEAEEATVSPKEKSSVYPKKKKCNTARGYCFSERTKKIVRDLIKIFIWLHKKGYTHRKLTVDDIVLFKTNYKYAEEFYPRITSSLKKHDKSVDEEAFSEACRSDWRKLGCIIRKMINVVDNEAIVSGEIKNLIKVLTENTYEEAKMQLFVGDHPALWTYEYRLTYNKLLMAEFYKRESEEQSNAIYEEEGYDGMYEEEDYDWCGEGSSATVYEEENSSENDPLSFTHIHGDDWQTLFPNDVLVEASTSSKAKKGKKTPKKYRVAKYDNTSKSFIRFMRNICVHQKRFLGTDLLRENFVKTYYIDVTAWLRRKIPLLYVNLKEKWYGHLRTKSHEGSSEYYYVLNL